MTEELTPEDQHLTEVALRCVLGYELIMSRINSEDARHANMVMATEALERMKDSGMDRTAVYFLLNQVWPTN